MGKTVLGRRRQPGANAMGQIERDTADMVQQPWRSGVAAAKPPAVPQPAAQLAFHAPAEE